jgi:hypothetical protein
VSKALKKNIEGAGPKAAVAAITPQGTWGEKKPYVTPTSAVAPAASIQAVRPKTESMVSMPEASPKPKKVRQSKQEGWTKVEVGKVLSA